MTECVRLQFGLNGRKQTLLVAPDRTLLDVLRDELGLIGTKEGCSNGDCGACTVIVNGKAVSSCRFPALKVDGCEVVTIEGLAATGELDAIQRAFLESGAVQCGYCTPGMVMSAKSLLTRNPRPSRDDIRAAFSGNLCRCTGYEQVIEAVETAIGWLSGDHKGSASGSGKPDFRVDGVSKVTGKTKFATDMELPGMLWVEAVRSPHPHAMLVSIDDSGATVVPGVVSVYTAKDIPGFNGHGHYNVFDQPVLVPVGGKVRFRGEIVAIVAASTRAAAKEGAVNVRVEYRVLPAVADVNSALASAEPQVHHKVFCTEYEYSRGDTSQGFVDSDVIIENTYSIAAQEHAYLETEAGLASYGDDGVVTVWGSAHDLWHLRQSIAKIIGIPESRVRAISPPIGGSFGSKQNLTVQPLVALVAYLTGRPAKMVWNRAESFMGSTKRHGVRVHNRLGATKNGVITAMDVDVVLDAGAYTAETPGVAPWMAMHITSAYEVPNLRVHSRAPFTNNPVAGAFRGFGGPQGILPTELQLHALAGKLNMDPAEIRRINALKPGSALAAPGVVMCGSNTLDTVLDAVVTSMPKKPSAETGLLVGRGIASTMSLYCVGAWRVRSMRGIGVDVEMLRDGSFIVYSSMVEMGVGTVSTLTSLAARCLGVTVDRVSFRYGDTDGTPKSGPQVASRTLFTSGRALEGATGELRGRIMRFVADKYGESIEHVALEDNVVRFRESGLAVELSKVAEAYYLDGRDPKACFWFDTDHTNAGHTFGAALADVIVDANTGQIHVERLWFAHDAGHALDLQKVRGQHFGGALQSVGYVVLEDLALAKGEMHATDLRTYMIPTIEDAPRYFRVIVLETPDEFGPEGARGVAEHANDLVPAAIACAVSDALGTVVTDYPMHPETVLQILGSSRGR